MASGKLSTTNEFAEEEAPILHAQVDGAWVTVIAVEICGFAFFDALAGSWVTDLPVGAFDLIKVTRAAPGGEGQHRRKAQKRTATRHPTPHAFRTNSIPHHS